MKYLEWTIEIDLVQLPSSFLPKFLLIQISQNVRMFFVHIRRMDRNILHRQVQYYKRCSKPDLVRSSATKTKFTIFQALKILQHKLKIYSNLEDNFLTKNNSDEPKNF